MPSQPLSPSCGTERSSKESYRDSVFSDQEDDPEFTEDESSAKQRLFMNDVEAQPTLSVSTPTSPTIAPEYRIPASRKLAYLALYFLLNLTLTIYNKAVLGTVSLPNYYSILRFMLTPASQFAFPWLLTALHATCSSVGCFVMYTNGVFNLTRLHPREHFILLAFSFLFTLNIAMSNVSL